MHLFNRLGTMIRPFFLLAVSAGTTGLAAQSVCSGFVPVEIVEDEKANNRSGITREQYDAIADRMFEIYEPVANGLGYTIEINRKWESSVINAASIYIGKSWNIQLDGGFPRYRGITPDAYALVVCHEIGHFIGGFPYKSEFSWTNAEGSADYFATSKCFRLYAARDSLAFNREAVAKFSPPARVTDNCRKNFDSEMDRLICLRSAKANLELSVAMSHMLREEVRPAFERFDPAQVAETNPNHPANQCRLDTYLAGALCKEAPMTMISWTDENIGACTPLQHPEVQSYRPRCWFKPSSY
jgi:hypothetical protein